MNTSKIATVLLVICLVVPAGYIATLPTNANNIDDTQTVKLDHQPIYKQAKLSIDTLSSKYILAYSPRQDIATVSYETFGTSDATTWTDIYDFRRDEVYRYTDNNCKVFADTHDTRTVSLHRHGPAWDKFNTYVSLNTTQESLNPTENTQITTYQRQATLTRSNINGNLTQTKYGLTGTLDGATQYIALTNIYGTFNIPTATPKTIDVSYTTTQSQSTNEITKQINYYKQAC